MGKTPLVSIIVPTYNNENTLEACLLSLIKQTYSNKEIIVVDDGSTDGTASLLSKMALKYPPLKIISAEHRGIAATRNLGVKYSAGDILFFGEADAVYNHDYLEKAVTCLAASPTMGGVCVTGGPLKTKSTFATECIEVENQIQHKLIREGKLGPFYAWVFRRETLDTIGGYDERLKQGEKKDFFQRMKKAGYPVGLVPGINWRHQRGESTWAYTKRSYQRARSRTLFLLKHQDITALLKAVGLPLSLGLGLALSLVFPFLLYLILFLLAVLFLYRMVYSIWIAWDCTEKKRYVIALPVFSALRYFSSFLGYSQALIVIGIRKLRGKQTDWTVFEPPG